MGYFDAKGQYTSLNNFPMNNSVDTMIVVFEDNLWFTSSRQGVMKKEGLKNEGLNNEMRAVEPLCYAGFRKETPEANK